MNQNPGRQGDRPLSLNRVHQRTPSVSTPPSTPGFDSPGNPLAPGTQRKQFQGGYEKTPRAPSFKPFALNNPGTPRQKAFDLSSPTSLKSMVTLDPYQWNALAL